MHFAASLFSRLDAWRHLPSYQLERRADVFFSLYLPEALEKKLGFAVLPELVPEFPVRVGTVYPDIPINKSFKIDYVAFSKDLARAVFVELKTDQSSRRPAQDKYLRAAREAGMPRLLGGVLDIFRATNAKRKYFRLLELLEKIGLLKLPARLRDFAAGANLAGINEASREVEVTCPASECRVVYLQPRGEGEDVLNFEEFAAVVAAHEDPVSQRFAESLRRWSASDAGEARRTES
jgi:hypothetical protein